MPLPFAAVVEIDQNIRPLIEVCWKKGFRTLFCCEGSAREDVTAKSKTDVQAHIVFHTTLEAAVFAGHDTSGVIAPTIPESSRPLFRGYAAHRFRSYSRPPVEAA